MAGSTLMGRKRNKTSGAQWWAIGLVAVVVAVTGGLVGAALIPKAPPVTAATAPGTNDYSGYFQQGDDGTARAIFIGDSYTGGSDMDSGPAYRFPARVAEKTGARYLVLARGGSGYLAVGPSGESIPQVVPEIPEDTDLVVIYGSINDGAPAADIQAAADAMIADIQTQRPEARILIVGPTWRTSTVPKNITANDQAIAAAAAARGVDYVSSLQEGWLRDRPELIGADGVHPNDAGHQELTNLMLPLVQERLPQPATAG